MTRHGASTRRLVLSSLAVALAGVASVNGASVAMAGSGKPAGSATFGHYACATVKTDSRAISGDCTVYDDRSDGHGVYLQVKGVRDLDNDTDWWRFSPNVSGKGTHTRFRNLYEAGQVGRIDSWKIRVCMQVANQADPCSGSDVIKV